MAYEVTRLTDKAAGKLSNVWHDGHHWLLEDDLLLGLAQKHKGIEACGCLTFGKWFYQLQILDQLMRLICLHFFVDGFVGCLVLQTDSFSNNRSSLQQDLLHTLMTFMERQSDLFHVKDLRVVYVLVPFPRYNCVHNIACIRCPKSFSSRQ